MRHTAVVRAFRAHSANNTFWEKKKVRQLDLLKQQRGKYFIYCPWLSLLLLPGLILLNNN